MPLQIIRNDITKVQCDAIVNAANSTLLGGGGVYGYPMNEAFKIAVDTVAEFLMHNDMLVYIVVYNKNALATSSKLFTDIAQYIDDNYVAEHSSYDSRRLNNSDESMPLPQTRFLS